MNDFWCDGALIMSTDKSQKKTFFFVIVVIQPKLECNDLETLDFFFFFINIL